MILNIITVSYNVGVDLINTTKSVQAFKGINKGFKEINHLIVLKTGECNEKVFNQSSIYYQESTGIYNAMNLGLSKIKENSYTLFLNAGDNILPIKIDYILKEFGTDDENGKLIRFRSIYKCSGQVVPKDNSLNRTFSHQSLFVRWSKEIIKYDEKFQISGDKDWYFKLLFREHFKLYKSDIILAEMDCDGVSRNGSRELQKFMEDTKVDLTYNQLNFRLIIYRIVKTFLKISLSKILTHKQYNKFLRNIGV